MQTLDEWLIAIHVLSAVIWVGGSFVTQIYAIRAQAGHLPLAAYAKETEWVGFRTFLPASVILLATGLLLVSRDVFELQAWVVWGLIVIGFSIISGAGFLGPEAGRIGQLIEERGDVDPEVRQRLGRLFLVSRVELVLLLSVVVVMVTKPGAG